MVKNYGVKESAEFLHKLFKEVNAFRIFGITANSLFSNVGIGKDDGFDICFDHLSVP